jgi:hypothetical protein
LSGGNICENVLNTVKIGSDYDPEWIEHQFQTYVVPYCDRQGKTDDFTAAQNAFLSCLKEGLAPRASAKLLKDKLEALLKNKTDAKHPTKATLACIDYLNFQIDLMDKPPPPTPAHTFRHTISVKGDSEILDFIYGNLILNGQRPRIVKHSDPNDVKKTDEQMQQMLRDQPIMFGTTRLEISFNSNLEQMKEFILKKFPNVTVN